MRAGHINLYRFCVIDAQEIMSEETEIIDDGETDSRGRTT